MRYLPNSHEERRRMLETCGVRHIEDLFAHLPPEVRLNRPLALPSGKSEFEILDYFQARGAECASSYASFLGAGAYRHYRPVLVDVVASRGEFLTAYTPYQAEISQGILTSIFEFQTMICQLTGMEVANASMYCGSTATAEAALMAARITGRSRILTSRAVHPEYRQVLHTMLRNVEMPLEEVGYDAATGQTGLEELSCKLDDHTAAVLIQSPNFFGLIEELDQAAELVHSRGALLVHLFTEPLALALLTPAAGADIVAGELQSFATPPSFGGPYAGVIATREQFVRQMPGRLVGETKDVKGNRAYCLTLSTREQHIRREKATSNICTNQALVALMATVFMTVYGKQGLRELAVQNLSKAHYLASRVRPRFSGPFFNEFVTAPGALPPEQINRRLLDRKIIGGLPLGAHYPELSGSMLLCATEMNSREQIDALAEVFPS